MCKSCIKDWKRVKYMGIGILAVVIIAVIYLLMPFGFGSLTLDGEYQVKIRVGDREMTATMENNTSSQAFKRMLAGRPRMIRMRDYGSMEKVGLLWRRLPTNNESITTKPGDIILYMGSSIVVYYEPNSWNFTRMGHINDVTQTELKAILGEGKVEMTFELLE